MNSKDGIDFTILLTLREHRRTSDSALSRVRSKTLRLHPRRLDSEALRCLQRWGKAKLFVFVSTQLICVVRNERMTEKTGKTQITFIGTGAMGKPMVRELLKNGYPVKVNDKLVKFPSTWPRSVRRKPSSLLPTLHGLFQPYGIRRVF